MTALRVGPAFGLVLSGGLGRRMGGDKPSMTLAGRSLLAHSTALLRRDCARVAVSVRDPGDLAAATTALGLPALPDPPGAPRGPLAGIAAGLRWAAEAGAEVLVTAPCDAPFLPADLPARLAEATTGRAWAVARTPGGLQPLCAAWRLQMLARLDAELGAGRHPSVRGMLEAAGCAFVDCPDDAAFLNINTPEDLAEAERRMAGGASA
jgi:molybdopterin-guanine dinucleotide biosynthesis protein A